MMNGEAAGLWGVCDLSRSQLRGQNEGPSTRMRPRHQAASPTPGAERSSATWTVSAPFSQEGGTPEHQWPGAPGLCSGQLRW